MDKLQAIKTHLCRLAEKLEFRDDQSHQARSDGWDFTPDKKSRRQQGIFCTYAGYAGVPMLVAENHAFAKVMEGALEAQRPALMEPGRTVVASRCLTALALTMLDIEDTTPKTARFRNVIRAKFWNQSFQWSAEKEGWGIFYSGGGSAENDELRIQRVDEAGIFANDDDAITHVAHKLSRGDCKLELRALCYLAACHDPYGNVDEEPVVTAEQKLVAQQLEQSLLCAQRMGLLEMLRPYDDIPHPAIDNFCSIIDRFTTQNPINF